VNALKDNSAPFHLRTSPAKPAVQPHRVHSVPAPEAPAPNMDIPSERNNENGGNFIFTLFMTLWLCIYIIQYKVLLKLDVLS
jgi:hypothetical protein